MSGHLIAALRIALAPDDLSIGRSALDPGVRSGRGRPYQGRVDAFPAGALALW